MPFRFNDTTLPGVVVIEPARFSDPRGFFMETYKRSDFVQAGIDLGFVQDNHSFSRRGVLRGLHFQLPPRAQGKLVWVVRGAVWDVAADIRPESPTFRKWLGEELSAETGRMIYVPPGFAHGFLTLSEEAHVLYKCTAEYDPALDRGIRWDDPDLGIAWPAAEVTLSDKDARLPRLQEFLDGDRSR